VCVAGAPWLLKMGTFGPGNMMVDIGSDFKIRCMTPDPWRTVHTHWFIYFTITSIYCRLYATNSSNGARCSRPLDTSRFSTSFVRYMLVLSVKSANINDTGLYTCSRPAYSESQKRKGQVAYVGMICTFLHNLYTTTKFSLMCFYYASGCKVHFTVHTIIHNTSVYIHVHALYDHFFGFRTRKRAPKRYERSYSSFWGFCCY